MHDRTQWIRGTTGDHIIKGKKYNSLTEYSRTCVTCGVPFSIFVTPKIASGQADTNSFGLKNCENHRRNNSAAQTEEIEKLRMANKVMGDELTGLYGQLADINAKLAKYELPSAMAAEGERAPENKMPWDT